MPFAQNVRDTIKKMAHDVRTELKNGGLQKLCELGCAITCDGVKIEETGRKYYDFILHFIIDVQNEQSVTKSTSCRIATRLLFIVRCERTE